MLREAKRRDNIVAFCPTQTHLRLESSRRHEAKSNTSATTTPDYSSFSSNPNEEIHPVLVSPRVVKN